MHFTIVVDFCWLLELYSGQTMRSVLNLQHTKKTYRIVQSRSRQALVQGSMTTGILMISWITLTHSIVLTRECRLPADRKHEASAHPECGSGSRNVNVTNGGDFMIRQDGVGPMSNCDIPFVLVVQTSKYFQEELHSK